MTWASSGNCSKNYIYFVVAAFAQVLGQKLVVAAFTL